MQIKQCCYCYSIANKHRNAEHESPLDPRPHYSLICIDENQNRETIHVTVEGVDAQTGEATVEEDKGQETK